MIRHMIIGLAGLPGSGKTTAIDYLRDVGFSVFDNGKVLEALFGDEYQIRTLSNKISALSVNGSMLPHVAPAIASVLAGSEKPTSLFIDSFKTLADPFALQNLLPNIAVETLALICPFSERQVRVQRRARLRDVATVAQRDAELAALGLNQLLENAKYRIDTHCSPSEMRSRVLQLGKEIQANMAAFVMQL